MNGLTRTAPDDTSAWGEVPVFMPSRIPDCAEEDPSLFYSETEDMQKRLRMNVVRRICAGCPVLAECLLHGLTYEEWGAWGGLSERERAALGGKARRSLRSFPPSLTAEEAIRPLQQAGADPRSLDEALSAHRERDRGAA